MNSEKEAKQEAIKRCEEVGKGKCRVIIFVRNGCFAAAMGKVVGTQNDGKFFAATSETPQTTERMALQKCQSSKEISECKLIIPSECSLP